MEASGHCSVHPGGHESCDPDPDRARTKPIQPVPSGEHSHSSAEKGKEIEHWLPKVDLGGDEGIVRFHCPAIQANKFPKSCARTILLGTRRFLLRIKLRNVLNLKMR